MSEPLKTYTPTRSRTGRKIGQELMEHVKECQLKRLGACKGPLDVAHLDGDENNNDRANLKKLCRSHHRLLDLNVITLDSTAMPPYRIRRDKGRHYGERVYLHERKAAIRRWSKIRAERAVQARAAAVLPVLAQSQGQAVAV